MKQSTSRGVLPIIVCLFLIGCAMPGQKYSSDPQIAQTQKWAEQCQKIDKFLVDSTDLIRTDSMSDTGVETVKRVNVIYIAVCLEGEPEHLWTNLQDSAVRATVADLCPGIVPDDDAVITLIMATECAAKNATLQLLQ